MPVSKYLCAASLDIGVERQKQEDYVQFEELDDETMFCVIADGTGSVENCPHPAAIVSIDMIDFIKGAYSDCPGLLLDYPELFIKMAMTRANRLLGWYKTANEEMLSGYAASVTCCLLTGENRITVGHAGNTRLYLLRGGIMQQMTRDNTKAAILLDENKIDINTYYVHPDRLTMTSGLGILDDPEFSIFSGELEENDLVLMTTDGVHYAINADAMKQLVLTSGSVDEASRVLIQASKTEIKYPDNMAAMVVAMSRSVDNRQPRTQQRR